MSFGLKNFRVQKIILTTLMNLKNMKTTHPHLRCSDDHLISIVFIIIAILITVLCAYLLSPAQPQSEAPPIPTDTAETYSEYTAIITPNRQVEVRARVNGYIEQIHFSTGSYVNKNDLLFTIDPTTYHARVNKAKAQLNKSKALALKAEHDLARIEPLYFQKAASRLDLDNAIAAYEAAKAEVIMSEADLAEAETALNYTALCAPISGFIGETTASIGSLINPASQSPLTTIVNIDTVQIHLNITELDYLRSIEPGTILTREISITLADDTTLSVIGSVNFSPPQPDSNATSFSVRIQIPNPNHTLVPGQSVKVKLPFSANPNPLQP